MAAITQHAIVKKERVKVCFSFFSPYSCFGLNLRHMLMPHMCCEMQNKLSKTRVSPLGSMGYIISSRCPSQRERERERLHACVCVCVCVRACVRACVRVCVCVSSFCLHLALLFVKSLMV